MKLLILGTFFFPEAGGAAARAVHMQAKGLAALGHDVTVMTSRADGKPLVRLIDGYTYRGVAIGTAPGGTLVRAFRTAIAQTALLGHALAAPLRRYDCVVMYGHAPIFALLAPFYRLVGMRSACQQGDLPGNNAREGLRARVKRKIDISAETITARNVEVIIVGGTAALVRRLSSIAPTAEIVKLWPPTDCDLFAEGNAERGLALSKCSAQDRIVAYAGAVTRLEGVDVLIRAMARVIKYRPDAKLVIMGRVGSGDPLSAHPMDVAGIVEENGVTDHVEVLGFRPMQDVVDVLAAAHVVVNAKVDHPANEVAAPIKIGEYLASGTPLVSARVCGLDDWLRHGEEAVFFEPGDSDALAEGILRVLNDEEGAKAMGAAGAVRGRAHCDFKAWATQAEAVLRPISGEGT